MEPSRLVVACWLSSKLFVPDLAPLVVSQLIDVANQLHRDLCSEGEVTELELAGTVGKRYKRQDEIGTPICITIDDDTLGPEQLVTLRSRDSRYAFVSCLVNCVY